MFILANFVERLSELMFEQGYNPPRLAEKIGCKRNTINRYLEGTFAPSLSAAIKLADCFNCSLDFLLGLDNENRAENFCNARHFAKGWNFCSASMVKQKPNLNGRKIYPNRQYIIGCAVIQPILPTMPC